MEYTPVEQNQDKKHEIHPMETTSSYKRYHLTPWIRRIKDHTHCTISPAMSIRQKSFY